MYSVQPPQYYKEWLKLIQNVNDDSNLLDSVVKKTTKYYLPEVIHEIVKAVIQETVWTYHLGTLKNGGFPDTYVIFLHSLIT